MKLILSAVAVATIFVGIAASQPADARCWFNGYSKVCDHRMDRFSEHRDWRFWRHDRDFFSGGGRERDHFRRNWGY